ncbi:hypothetical protein L1887_38761 [Cichorium endivia]|nr:hypothetical protein L1887_38761 [Cichorium endivia]
MSGKDCVSSSNKNESAVFEKVQAWEAMTDLAEPSSKLSESGEFYIIEDPTGLGKENPNSKTSSFRSYAGVLANLETCPPSGPETSAEQTTQEKSPKDEEDYWEIVVKKESTRQKHDYTSENTANKQYLRGTGDGYQRCRYKANQIWDLVKSLKDQAIKARADRRWNDADDLENQARMHEKTAQQADESASQDMFDLIAETVGC